MAKYKISKLAELDLEDIWNYTVYEWSIEQAEKYLNGFGFHQCLLFQLRFTHKSHDEFLYNVYPSSVLR